MPNIELIRIEDERAILFWVWFVYEFELFERAKNRAKYRVEHELFASHERIWQPYFQQQQVYNNFQDVNINTTWRDYNSCTHKKS